MTRESTAEDLAAAPGRAFAVTLAQLFRRR